MPTIKELWSQIYQLGYQNCNNPNRFQIWDLEKLNYDDHQILGTWIEATPREKNHMRAANHQEAKFPKNSFDYIAWRTNSQTTRIRTSSEEGGSGVPPTARNLLEISYNLGGVCGIREEIDDEVGPAIENYVDFD